MTTKRRAFTDIVNRVSLEDLTEAVLSQDPDRLGALMTKVPFFCLTCDPAHDPRVTGS